MAYIRIRKNGKLVLQQEVDAAKARKGYVVRLSSDREVFVGLGEAVTEGKYVVELFEGEPPLPVVSDTEAPVESSIAHATVQETSEEMAVTTTSAGPVSGSDGDNILPTLSDTGQDTIGDEDAAPSLDGYQIVGMLSESGGQGTIWRAKQLGTNREVALKFLRAGAFSSDTAKTRFQREVELSASLAHPNVARVYDTGIHQGAFYYAMELINGLNLDDYVQQSALGQRQVLVLMQKVCRAIQFAHQRGIIHRDLKPSNIMVTPDGEPHVLDFGLAKSFVVGRESMHVSIDGDVAGTPAYMSPEQASGKVDILDTRTDVYSLGTILYQLLTEQLPHNMDGSRHEVLRQIAEEDVRRPRQVSKVVDRELESLLLKALSHDPDCRYGTAGELADDIENYLSGDPLTARPPTTTYFLRKRLRRYRVPVAITALVLLGLLGMAGYTYLRVAQEKDRAVLAKQEALHERDRAAQEAARAEAESDRAEKEASRAGASEQDALAQAKRADSEAQGRLEQAERADLEAQKARKAEAAATAQRDVAMREAQAADEARAEATEQRLRAESEAAAALAAMKQAWEATERAEAEQKRAEEAAALVRRGLRAQHLRDVSMAFEERDKDYDRANELLMRCPENLRHWEWHYLQTSDMDLWHWGVKAASFSPDGQMFVTASDHEVRVWDAASGEVALNLRGVARSPACFVGDGSTLITSTTDGTLALWSVSDGEELTRIDGQGREPDGLIAVSHSGDMIASFDRERGVLHIIPVASESSIKSIEVGQVSLEVLAFSEDDKTLAFAIQDAVEEDGYSWALWDVSKAKKIADGSPRSLAGVPIFPGSEGAAQCFGFSRDCQKVAYVTYLDPTPERAMEGGIRLFDTRTGDIEEHVGRIGLPGSYESNVQQISARTETGTNIIYQLPEFQQVYQFAAQDIISSALSPDGRRVLAWGGEYGNEGRIWLREIVPSDRMRDIELPFSGAHNVAFSPKGDLMAVAAYDGSAVTIVIPSMGTTVETISREVDGAAPGVSFLTFSPAGSTVLLDTGSTIVEHDIATGQVLGTYAIDPNMTDGSSSGWSMPMTSGTLAFSSDGTRLICCTPDTCVVWDAETRRQLAATMPPADSEFVATNGDVVLLRDTRKAQYAVVDLESGDTTAAIDLNGMSEEVQYIFRLSKDGMWLLGMMTDGQLCVISTETGDVHSVLSGSTIPSQYRGGMAALVSYLSNSDFSPDGQRVIGGGEDAKLRIWDRDTGVLTTTLDTLGGQILCVKMSPTLRYIAAAPLTGRMRIWDAGNWSSQEAETSLDDQSVPSELSDDAVVWEFSEQTIAQLPSDVYDKAGGWSSGVRLTPDGEHIVYIRGRHGQKTVVYDDEACATDGGGAYLYMSPGLGTLFWKVYSHDERVAYWINGEQQQRYRKLTEPIFSEDDSRYAYAGIRDDARWGIVIDGLAGPTYQSLEVSSGASYNWQGALFSPDSSRFAYTAKDKGNWYVVCDGESYGPYQDVRSPVFSSDSEHIAFAAKLDNGWSVVKDGEVDSRTWDGIRHLNFMGDNSLVYVGANDSGHHIVHGDELATYERVYDQVVAPGGRSAVHIILDDGKRFVISGEHRSSGYDEISDITFSDDGNRLAWVGKVDGYERLIADWQELAEYDRVEDIRFSSDGQSLGATAHKEGHEFTVIDGKEGPKMDRVRELDVGPSGSQSLYIGRDEQGVDRVQLGDRLFQGYAWISSPVLLDPTRQHVAYVTKRDGQYVLAVDDSETEPYDHAITFLGRPTWGYEPTVFSDQDGNPYTFFIRGNKIIRVTASRRENASEQSDAAATEDGSLAWSPAVELRTNPPGTLEKQAGEATSPQIGRPASATPANLKVTATITGVSDGIVSIDAGTAKGVLDGTVFYIYRDSIFIANLEILTVDDSESAGRIYDVRPGYEPQVGDKAAISVE